MRSSTTTVLGLLCTLLLAGCGAQPTRAPESLTPTSQTGALTGAQAGAQAGAQVRLQPDVLVITTDDMRADELRWMPRTRSLLEERGLVFTNSFAPNPLCCPSRSSFPTGRLSHNTGVLSHLEPYGFASFRDRTTLATALRGVGYRTAMVGKYLNGYGVQPLRQHHRASGSSARYVPPGWTRWLAGIDFGSPAMSRRLGITGNTYNYARLSQDVDGRPRTTTGYSTAIMGTQVRRLVDGFSRGAAPWFVWWNPVAPHGGGPVEPDDPTRLGLATPARPAWVRGTLDRQLTRAPGVRADGTTESDLSDKPRWMQRPELGPAERAGVLEVARQRAESLLVLDREVATTLTRLWRTPRGRHAYVVLTSDNGYYLGEHRQPQGKGTLLEPSLRVPLLVAGPGVPRGERDDPATTVDLAPTIAGWTGAPLPAGDGTDLASTIAADRGWTRPVVTGSRMPSEVPRTGPDPGLTVRGLRLGGWAVHRYARGDVELYDMVGDPLQLANLAAEPAYAAQRTRLLALLDQLQDCRGAACTAPLPADLALDPAANEEVTRAQQRATQDYYGVPTP